MAQCLSAPEVEHGFSRRRCGKGFIYLDYENNTVTDKTLIKRFQKLIIPPAWRNVWIAKDPEAYLQASGWDQRGRKQYIYHPKWAEARNVQKFNRAYQFGLALAEIRQAVDKDLRLPDWPKQKVVALAIAVLDRTHIRVGNPCYTKENHTYGLTTLRRKHLKRYGKQVVFSYLAKGGKYREVQLNNPRLVKLVSACSELPGAELFRYRDEMGKTHPIGAQDIAGYLEKITGTHFTAKDFRTWGACIWALKSVEGAKEELKKYPRRSLESAIVKRVCHALGNTPAICKKYYIHPAIWRCLNSALPAIKESHTHLSEIEQQLLAILAQDCK